MARYKRARLKSAKLVLKVNRKVRIIDKMRAIWYTDGSLIKEIFMEFGKKVKEERLKFFLTQKEMANKLGVSVNTIIRWENNQCKPNLKDQKKFHEFCEEKD